MDEIKELFISIGKENIDESEQDLFASGLIDSLDIIALVSAIKSKYNKSIEAKYLKADNFKNFSSIKKMLEESLKN